MTHTERLVEQNFREYHSRLRNRDEKPVHARLRSSMLSSLQDQHAAYAVRYRNANSITYLHELRLQSLSNWLTEAIAMAGPMSIWDAVAQQLEKLIEKFEH